MSSMADLNVSKVPMELQKLIALLNSPPDPQKTWEFAGLIGDSSFLLQLAIHHRLFPLLHKHLEATTANPESEEFHATMKRLYQHNALLMLRLGAELSRVCGELAVRRIRTLVLKGPALAEDLYRDLTLRSSSDLDILVSFADLEQTDGLLQGMGYRKDEYFQRVLNDWKWRHHHLTYYHPKSGTKIEMHWRLNPGPGREPAFDELWSRRREAGFFGQTLNLLSREDLFVFLVAHGARHGWSRLRWLADIRQMIELQLDWQQLNARLHKYRMQHQCGQALLLVSRLFQAEPPVQLQVLCRSKRALSLAQDAIFYLERMVNLHNPPLPREVEIHHKRYLFRLMPLYQKIWFVLSFLYPYPEDAELLPLPKSLHMLYFPLRPVLWLWRKTKKLNWSGGTS